MITSLGLSKGSRIYQILDDITILLIYQSPICVLCIAFQVSFWCFLCMYGLEFFKSRRVCQVSFSIPFGSFFAALQLKSVFHKILNSICFLVHFELTNLAQKAIFQVFVHFELISGQFSHILTRICILWGRGKNR